MKFYANLKCNHTRASFSQYSKTLSAGLSSEDVCVFAPATTFLNEKFNFLLGAQNFYPCESGAFTGEIGKAHLDEFNIKNVLIGHSERREICKESEEFLKIKFEYAVKNDWSITYCIGESLDVFESNKTRDFLSEQLKNIDLNYKNLIIAYEPIWAIGTGKSANIEEITDILDFIATFTDKPLLYGGSVNAKNISQIANIKNCSGVLVGTASLSAENFLNLIQNAKI